MNIRIGTNEIQGTFHRQGEVLAGLLRPDYVVETKPMLGSSVGSALGLHSGELQFGFSASNWIGRARRGEDPFKEPIDIRIAAPANVGPMFFVVRANSDLFTINDLKGRKVSVGPADSGMYQHTKTIFDILRIPFNAFEPIHMSFTDGSAALKSGDIDAQWQCPIPNPVMTDLAENTKVRVLEYGAGQLDKVLSKAKFYRRALLPAGAFKGIKHKTFQVGVLNVIMTHKRVDNSLVAKLVSAMLVNAEHLGKKQELYQGLSKLFNEINIHGRTVFEPDGVPLHEGAIQAFQAAGLLNE